MSAKIVVRHDDGTTEMFNPNRPRLLLDMEKRFGVQTPERHEHVAWLAHHALAPDQPFDDWVDTVEEFESKDEDEEEEKAGQQGGTGKAALAAVPSSKRSRTSPSSQV